jgi:hypothetical protein
VEADEKCRRITETIVPAHWATRPGGDSLKFIF